jgi:hypothetical protein
MGPVAVEEIADVPAEIENSLDPALQFPKVREYGVIAGAQIIDREVYLCVVRIVVSLVIESDEVEWIGPAAR